MANMITVNEDKIKYKDKPNNMTRVSFDIPTDQAGEFKALMDGACDYVKIAGVK